MNAPRWEAGADLVVVGSGVAGLSAALEAHELGLRTLVVTKDDAGAGSTRWAQGGIAVVLDDGHEPGDSVHRHVADTLAAAGGLADPAAVAAILADGPAAVSELRGRGAVFDPGPGGLALAREGGHSAFRVVHAGGDATGAEVQRALLAAARDTAPEPLPILTDHLAVDVLPVSGKRCYDTANHSRVAGILVVDGQGRPGVVRARAVVLATGGYGQLYASTTNPDTSTGDGLALALRAGAPAADLEFVQFHPTVLYTGPGARGRRPLVTEAVRGHGAVLVDAAGRRVMAGEHPLEDLAPRDVVSAAIARRMAATGASCVYLDATALDGFAERFPTVHAAARAIGVDPATEPIPVSPAAHYTCGGVLTDVHGRTGVAGLYAAGEVARSGLHGANRLASNSLLEGLVMGRRAARAVAADLAGPRRLLEGPVGDPSPPTLKAAARDLVQRTMTWGASIGRDGAGLAAASDAIDAGTAERAVTDRATGEDAALTLIAQAVLAAAGTRTESRGCHVRTDFPRTDDAHQRRSLVVELTDGALAVRPTDDTEAGAA
ncbi:L-aspartate oxidase [Pseudonocardia acaciae]|uniref:L-aspartate oxidase n=1 Tax=Pseudonocardia acaciae TaxID=551276 RepID=UPI000686E6B5|nr:L-aspartate oxidase [Pseudonocardia acaciae]